MEEILTGKEQLLPRATDVKPFDGHIMLLTFDNGEVREFDASSMMDIPAYKDLASVFCDARIECGTVVWPGDIDVSPDTLYLRSIPVPNI